MIDREAGARQQVLGLKSKNTPHLEAVDEALLAAVEMSHMVDELTGVDLRDQVTLEEPMPPDHDAPVRQRERRLLISLHTVGRLGEAMDGRVEDVEHELSIAFQMASDGGEAGELFLHRHEVLERPKRDGHQTERAAELEISHVAPLETGPPMHIGRLGAQATAAGLEHPFGRIEPYDLDAGACGGDQDASRPAAELEDGSP